MMLVSSAVLAGQPKALLEDEDEDEDGQRNRVKIIKLYWDFNSARRQLEDQSMNACFASEPSITRNIKDIIDFKLSLDQPKIIRKQGTDMDIFWCIVDALAQECNHGKFSDVRRRHEDQFFALIGDTGFSSPRWLLDSGASVCSTGNCNLLLGLRRADPVSAANGQSISSNYCGRAGGVVNLSQTAPQTTGLISSSEPIAADNSSLLTPDTTPEQTWRVASAAPQHMTGYLNHLIDYTPASGDQVIDTPNMGPLAVHGRGSVNTANITLQDVLYVPCLDANLVSTGQLAQLGYMITLGPYGCRIYKDDEDMPLVGEAHYVDGYLLELDFLRVRPSTN